MEEKKRRVELLVNGKKVGLNPYVKSVFQAVIRGLLSTLKGVDEPAREVELKMTLE